jgi:hypothetical protein
MMIDGAFHFGFAFGFLHAGLCALSGVFSALLLWDAFNMQFDVFRNASRFLRLAVAFMEIAVLALFCWLGLAITSQTFTAMSSNTILVGSMAVILRWIRSRISGGELFHHQS